MKNYDNVAKKIRYSCDTTKYERRKQLKYNDYTQLQASKNQQVRDNLSFERGANNGYSRSNYKTITNFEKPIKP
jgi:excinuclease UvrABC helicase subunit UvrB